MINSGEVRIGSYVLVTFDESDVGFGNDFISKVVAIQCLKIMVEGDMHWHPIDSISPVSLSPFILEKCGFVDDNENQMITYYKLPIKFGGRREFVIKEFYANIVDDFDNCIVHYSANNKTCSISIKYLHQLQNLYFALTGQELEVNL